MHISFTLLIIVYIRCFLLKRQTRRYQEWTVIVQVDSGPCFFRTIYRRRKRRKTFNRNITIDWSTWTYGKQHIGKQNEIVLKEMHLISSSYPKDRIIGRYSDPIRLSMTPVSAFDIWNCSKDTFFQHITLLLLDTKYLHNDISNYYMRVRLLLDFTSTSSSQCHYLMNTVFAEVT